MKREEKTELFDTMSDEQKTYLKEKLWKYFKEEKIFDYFEIEIDKFLEDTLQEFEAMEDAYKKYNYRSAGKK